MDVDASEMAGRSELRRLMIRQLTLRLTEPGPSARTSLKQIVGALQQTGPLGNAVTLRSRPRVALRTSGCGTVEGAKPNWHMHTCIRPADGIRISSRLECHRPALGST